MRTFSEFQIIGHVGKVRSVGPTLRVDIAADYGRKDDAAADPLAGGNHASIFDLPYRMIFAVATQDSVWIYDTQQGGPICCFSNMHYASFTDLSW